MAKPISLLYSILKLSSLAILLSFSSGCNPHRHSSCSDRLPLSESSDSLLLFSASADKLNNYNGMVLIPSGSYLMGAAPSDEHSREDELPQHYVQMPAFWMDKTEVTNKQFAEFVKQTGYVTTAERYGGSLVFIPGNKANGDLYWWQWVEGASWKSPFGKKNQSAAPDQPVVHVSWYDAMAYASWAGKRLPTEAEWEYAARGGLANKIYPWGNENPESKKKANVFQGKFPAYNTRADGFEFLSPVQSFASNGYGLYDMSGNVWEWCADKYHSAYYPYCTENNITTPQGPNKSYAAENRYEDLRVIRGGSFMCNKSYCTGYRVSARNKTSPSTSLLNIGFRCVRDSL